MVLSVQGIMKWALQDFNFFQASDIRGRVNLINSLITNEEVEPHRESSLLSMHFKIRKHHVREGKEFH